VAGFNLIIEDLKLDLELCSGEWSSLSFFKNLLHPSFQVSLFYRLSRYFYLNHFEFMARMVTAFSRSITGCDIHFRSQIEGGVLFPHGRGIVIGQGVVISKRCSIFHNVTLGASENQEGYPLLKEGVNVYPGSVIAGDIEVGEYCRIGPNVYLTESVGSHTRIKPAPPINFKS